jgi:hypothetical protein
MSRDLAEVWAPEARYFTPLGDAILILKNAHTLRRLYWCQIFQAHISSQLEVDSSV